MQSEHTNDEEHLRLLSIFHWVIGGLGLAYSLLTIFQFAFMTWMMDRGPRFPPEFQAFMLTFLFVAFVITTAGSCAAIYSGFQMRERTKRTFSLVVAGVLCLAFPIGTILGVFTIVVLQRESVRKLYGET